MRDRKRQLIPACICHRAKYRSKPGCRVVFGGNVMHAGVKRALGPIKQRLEVEALQRGWNHPEEGERRVAPTDVRRVKEYPAEAVTFGHLLHQRSGIGYGDEILARTIALYLPDPVKEIFVEHQRLGCSPGLAGDDEHRMRKIDALFKTLHSGWVCAVQYMKLREAI